MHHRCAMDKTKVVYKDNALIHSCYRLSVLEQRILLACICKVRKDEVLTDDVMYEVHASELVYAEDQDKDFNYTKLREAARKLLTRTVSISLEPNGQGKKEKVLVTRWIQSYIEDKEVYNEQEGAIQLRFSRDILPYLNQLKGHFTKYAYADISSMTSAHAIRIYELVSSYKNLGKVYIALDELKEKLGLQGEYKVIADFKKWVLEPAIEQINEFTPLKLNYKNRKSGRSIIGFDFTIKQPKKIAATNKKSKPTQKIVYNQRDVAYLAREGETWRQLLDRLRKDGYVFKFKPNYEL